MSSVDILVPDLPESVADATVATWHKKPGDAVVRDEVLVEIETDKVVLEVPASADGILDAVLEDEGATVLSRQILGRLREGNSAGKESSEKADAKASTPARLPRRWLALWLLPAPGLSPDVSQHLRGSD
ncbi:biotin/lipoyl-containing protein, partial [Klebsiella quasipneumoniae]|uniref:biotin/lipoyl-containing protein n=1 Tax=Klebsiella quasipneumoniae TaxID=1463165 RepID=UPI00283AA52C